MNFFFLLYLSKQSKQISAFVSPEYLISSPVTPETINYAKSKSTIVCNNILTKLTDFLCPCPVKMSIVILFKNKTRGLQLRQVTIVPNLINLTATIIIITIKCLSAPKQWPRQALNVSMNSFNGELRYKIMLGFESNYVCVGVSPSQQLDTSISE